MSMTKRDIARFVLTGIISFLFHASADAFTSNSSINVSVIIPSSSCLTFGATTLRFTPDDPTLQPSVPAQENPVTVLAKIRSKGASTLSVIASDDLKDGANTIPVSAITWTTDAEPFHGGTLNKSTAQPAAVFASGSGTYQSSFRYFLTNSNMYVPGTYSTNINYTLTAP